MIPADVRETVRRWRRRPGVALVCSLVLALGIGTTTAMFSVVDAVLLRPEPWQEADELVAIYGVLPAQRTNPAYAARWEAMPIGLASWRDLQKSPAFDGVGVWVSDEQILGDTETTLVKTFYASSTLLPLFSVRPLKGRLFTESDDAADTNTVILSHATWLREFGGRDDVIGQVTRVTRPGAATTGIAGRRTIVGVLPATFRFPGGAPDVLLPLGFHAYNLSFPTNQFLNAIGKLAPGTSLGAASAAAEPIVRREETPDRRTARLITLKADRVGIGAQPLWLMLAGAGLLLVVACSNVAGLLLSEARERHHETAVRLALGGSRLRILRQVAVEQVLLSMIAGAAGVGLSAWLIPMLSALAPPRLIGVHSIGLDPRVAGLSLVSAVITTLLAGLIPAAAISSTRPGDALKRAGREITRGGRWRHRAVVVAQFGLALVLLVSAALFGETLVRLGRQPLGFSPQNVVIVSVVSDRQSPRVFTPAEREKWFELRRDPKAFSRMIAQDEWHRTASLLARVKSVSGVTHVSTAVTPPFVPPRVPATVRVREDGRPASDDQIAHLFRVSEDYFDAMGIRFERGRRLTPDDFFTIPMPVVISKELERRVFGGPGADRRLRLGETTVAVVGVVADVRQLARSDEGQAAMYTLPTGIVTHLAVRTAGDPAPLVPQIRQAIETHDAPMFVTSITPLSEIVAGAVAIERGRARLSGAYGAVALLLASVGLYGLAARLVAERRREIGIRVALGALRRDVRRLVMKDAWLIVGVGLALGVPAAFLTSRLAEGLLYGVAPAAPHVLGVAAAALVVAAIVATLVPSIRASRIDPAVTLRDE